METISGWMRPYLAQIAMAIVATLLVVYGSEVNRFVKKRVQRYPFLLRLLIFVLLCMVGYGLLLVAGSMGLAWLLSQVKNQALCIVVVLLFLVIGFLAERKNQM